MQKQTLKVRLIVVGNDPEVIAEEKARLETAFGEWGYNVVIGSGIDTPEHDAIITVGYEEVVIGSEKRGRIFAKIVDSEEKFWSNDYGEVAAWVVDTLFREGIKNRHKP